MAENVLDKLVRYCKIKTPSNEESQSSPSSIEQFDLAKLLVKELEQLGLKDIYLSDSCYVYAKLPATVGMEELPPIGFIAHMDTVKNYTESEISPQIIENYNGEDIVLKNGLVIAVEKFEHLKYLVGCTILTSDGNTVLGVDDKAGIAEIMALLEYLIENKVPHCGLSVCFTPDEEIGRGADKFDVNRFDAPYAYTVDGGPQGEIEYECFNAAKAVFDITGVDVHPGSAYDIMINANDVAMDIANSLSPLERPRNTKDYEGFYYLTNISGDGAKARLEYIIRDFDSKLFQDKCQRLVRLAEVINKQWNKQVITVKITEQYKNMAEIIRDNMFLIDNAKTACELADVEPKIVPIRGGTDGARLSFMGLPCPNLGTGGYCFHGPYEHTTKEGMEDALNILKELVRIYSR